MVITMFVDVSSIISSGWVDYFYITAYGNCTLFKLTILLSSQWSLEITDPDSSHLSAFFTWLIQNLLEHIYQRGVIVVPNSIWDAIALSSIPLFICEQNEGRVDCEYLLFEYGIKDKYLQLWQICYGLCLKDSY